MFVGTAVLLVGTIIAGGGIEKTSCQSFLRKIPT
jgi:hypothetical protein